jgi:hypothetical protein
MFMLAHPTSSAEVNQGALANRAPSAKMRKLFLACLLMTGCATRSPDKITVPQDSVYLRANGWVALYGSGVKLAPTAKGCSFDFPPPPGHVNYVMTPYAASKSHKTMRITFKITALSGSPQFVSIEQGCGNQPADFRLLLERQGDTLSSTQEFFRWWSNPDHVKLVADGQLHTLTVPLIPERWSSVFGKFGSQVPSEFNTGLQNLAGVGITFGGGCFFGHGVHVTDGKARFELIDFRIQ